MNQCIRFISTLVFLLCSDILAAGEYSTIIRSQSAYQLDRGRFQQQEWAADIEYNKDIFGGELTIIGRARFDSVKSLNVNNRSKNYSNISGPVIVSDQGMIELREFYWDGSIDEIYLRLGRQQVVWGEADGLKLLDVINPQSYREFILDDTEDSRIPLWMANLEYAITDDHTLQFLFIPDTSTHELAPDSSPFAISSPVLVPQQNTDLPVLVSQVKAPAVSLANSDVGIRLTGFVSGWDYSLNYLNHYIDSPIVRASLKEQTIYINQEYKRSHLMGSSVSTVFGDWILRGELAYETNRYHRSKQGLPGVLKTNQWSTVIGLDWQGWSDQFISVQWFQTTIVEYDKSLISDRREDTATLLWESKFLNETLTLKWLHIHSLDHHDGVVRPKVTYNFLSNLDIYISMDSFYGDRESLFGQFNDNDRISFGFEWGL